jgi:ABC-type transport system substrate-binding protein
MDEMKQSKYDSDGDGKCDADVCNDVLMINRNYPPWTDMTPTLQQNLAEIGINIKMRELDSSTAYTTINTVNKLIPIASNAGWGKDYADPSTFGVLFDSSGILCEGAINYSNVGMTADQAKECGVESQFNAVKDQIPSVDAEFDKCQKTQGDARNGCWAQFDQNLMENVVPWVPYLWATVIGINADSVTKYEFDQFGGNVSYSHIAVNNGIDPNDVAVG